MQEITIGADDGEFLTVSIAGRSHPDADDYWDGNWLQASVHVRAGGFCASVVGDIRSEELAAFVGPLADVQKSLHGVAEFDTLEAWLSIRATGDGMGHIEVHCVVLDQPGIGNRLEFTLKSEQTFVQQTVSQLTAAIKVFPVVGRA